MCGVRRLIKGAWGIIAGFVGNSVKFGSKFGLFSLPWWCDAFVVGVVCCLLGVLIGNQFAQVTERESSGKISVPKWNVIPKKSKEHLIMVIVVGCRFFPLYSWYSSGRFLMQSSGYVILILV